MALTDKLSAIGDAIRARTGKTGLLTLDQMPGEIAGITGGGSSADVRYVTFMNGDTVLYKKPVAVGDDCVDVVSKGLIPAPIKESDVQYNYTYYGWGASDGGAANANILKNVTEDKTVYAIYTATVRTYTITYYDSNGTTVLKTEKLAYGATPDYMPTKSGVSFGNWSPAPAEVTGDASYTAVWIEKLTFAGSTWEDIARVSEAGQATDHFSLGDTRVINVDGVDVTFQIVGFNHDVLADGSGTAGITVIAKTLMGRQVQFAKSNCTLYENSTLDSTVTGYLSTLAAELQGVIKNVKKEVHNVVRMTYSDAVNAANNKKTINRKIWVPSHTEMGAYWYTGAATFAIGTMYAYMDNKQSARYPAGQSYWTRSLGYQNSSDTRTNYMFGPNVNGALPHTSTSDVLIGFCI